MDERIQALINAPASRNPAIELYLKLKGEEGRSFTAEELLLMEKEIRDTIELGEKELKQVEAALGRLRDAPSLPAPFVPWGF